MPEHCVIKDCKDYRRAGALVGRSRFVERAKPPSYSHMGAIRRTRILFINTPATARQRFLTSEDLG